jgi:hypothetical protein
MANPKTKRRIKFESLTNEEMREAFFNHTFDELKERFKVDKATVSKIVKERGVREINMMEAMSRINDQSSPEKTQFSDNEWDYGYGHWINSNARIVSRTNKNERRWNTLEK